MKGADIVINCLIEQGVDAVFGYPGGKILDIYDALYRSGKIKHYLTAHEQGASHAADGYARVTGKVGVCIATSGPGATNLVTGIATAYMDSIPVVAITCNVPNALLGKDSFQEVDITGVTMPVTKHNYIVQNIRDLADTIREAFYIARSGRPGPVLIDIPADVASASYDYEPLPLKSYDVCQDIDAAEIAGAVKLIDEAKRPLMLIGGGVVSSGADSELIQLQKKLNCPVASTLMGIGAFPTTADAYTGMVGMHGSKASNVGVNTCDLLIAVGTRFSDRVTSDIKKFAKNAKILHIDIDKAELKKNVLFASTVTGDAKCVLAALNKKVATKKDNEWLNECLELKKEFPHMDMSETAPINPEYLFAELYKRTKGDAVIVTEVGQHQMWTAQFYPFTRSRELLTSGGLGTMGYGTGAAIGASVAINHSKRVVNIAGDGCFRMNCNELATISYYNIPVIIVVVNNGTLGMVRQWQTLFYQKRYSETTLDRAPNFKKLAEAYSIDGYTVTNKDELKYAFDTAFSKNAPAVIDVQIDTDEFVFPMVAPGQPISNLLTKK